MTLLQAEELHHGGLKSSPWKFYRPCRPAQTTTSTSIAVTTSLSGSARHTHLVFSIFFPPLFHHQGNTMKNVAYRSPSLALLVQSSRKFETAFSCSCSWHEQSIYYILLWFASSIFIPFSISIYNSVPAVYLSPLDLLTLQVVIKHFIRLPPSIYHHSTLSLQVLSAFPLSFQFITFSSRPPTFIALWYIPLSLLLHLQASFRVRF